MVLLDRLPLHKGRSAYIRPSRSCYPNDMKQPRAAGIAIALIFCVAPLRAGHPTNSPLPSRDPENVRGYGDAWALAGFSYFAESAAKSQAVRNAKAQCPNFFRGWGVPDPKTEPVILYSGCQKVGASRLGRDCSATAKVRCVKGDQPPPDDMAVVPLAELSQEHAGLAFEAASRFGAMTTGEASCFDKQLQEFMAWAHTPREVGNTAADWLKENGIKKVVIEVRDLSKDGDLRGVLRDYGTRPPLVSWSNKSWSKQEIVELMTVTLDRSRQDAECRVVDEAVLERWRFSSPFANKNPAERTWRGTAGQEPQ